MADKKSFMETKAFKIIVIIVILGIAIPLIVAFIPPIIFADNDFEVNVLEDSANVEKTFPGESFEKEIEIKNIKGFQDNTITIVEKEIPEYIQILSIHPNSQKPIFTTTIKILVKENAEIGNESLMFEAQASNGKTKNFFINLEIENIPTPTSSTVPTKSPGEGNLLDNDWNDFSNNEDFNSVMEYSPEENNITLKLDLNRNENGMFYGIAKNFSSRILEKIRNSKGVKIDYSTSNLDNCDYTLEFKVGYNVEEKLKLFMNSKNLLHNLSGTNEFEFTDFEYFDEKLSNMELSKIERFEIVIVVHDEEVNSSKGNVIINSVSLIQ